MDLRRALNAISDVVANRPPALREFDQIYMKHADILLQTELISKHFVDKDIIFIGDGDAVGLCLAYLTEIKEIKLGPRYIKVLDFDERVVNSVNNFAKRYNISHKITAQLYNVVDPLPEEVRGVYSGFYTNPPYGAKNHGTSIKVFIQRGLEASGYESIGCVVLADRADDNTWAEGVLFTVQKGLIDNNCLITEMVPNMHTYHLDDDKKLTSCSLIFRKELSEPLRSSLPLENEVRRNFYGDGKHLNVRYVRDIREYNEWGFAVSKEYNLENMEEKIDE